MTGFMRRDPERGDRGRMINVSRKTKPLSHWIIMIAQEVVSLDHLNIVDVCRLQNFPGRFRAGDIRGRAHRSPFLESAAHPELRDEPDDQRSAHQQ